MDIERTALWTVTLLLGVPSALLIPLNWLSVVGAMIEARHGRNGHFSFAPPFLCGIAGAVACLVCPLPGVWRWAWIPPLIDPSITSVLVAALLHLVARAVGMQSPFDCDPPTPDDT